jgi:ribonuclease VapC
LTSVLDASALLAWLQEEPGADVVRDRLNEGVVTAVNWSEVLRKADQHGRDAREVGVLLLALGLKVVDVTKEDGEEAARLWPRAQQLSLADRICLAAAKRLNVGATTAESEWDVLKDQLAIEVIR